MEQSAELTISVMRNGGLTPGGMNRERQVTPAGKMAGSVLPLGAHNSLQTPRALPRQNRDLPARGAGRAEMQPAESRRKLALILSPL